MGGPMETKTFLSKALSSGGYYCVFAARSSDERKAQKFYDTIDAVVDAAHNYDKEGYDVYYGLATFDKAGSRKVDNVKRLNSFFLDLDCGPSKEFLNQEQAIQALRRFCKHNKLPKPTMVNSGRGIHAYWFLSESVCLDDWLPVAERLKRLCAQQNFYADPAVTSDAARVLRVPHTHNYKTNPPSDVGFFGLTAKFETVDFDKFSELLGSESIPVPTKNIPRELSATMQNLMGNQENKFKDILIKTQKGEGCEQLKYIVRNQETMSEPLWRAGLSIAKFCTDGEKAIHLMSKGHPDYTPDDTKRKVEQIKGPYTCVRFDEYNPDICRDCPQWGVIKSPIVLGKKLREAETDDEGNYVAESIEEDEPTHVIPKYPPPYVRGSNGGVYIRTANEDGDVDEKRIYHNDLYVVKRIRDPEMGESLVMRLHLPRDGVQEFSLPMSSVTSSEEFRKKLSSQGVAVKKMDELMSYTLSWVDELQATSTADDAHVQFGWANDKMDTFILGNQKVRPDCIEFNPPANQTVGFFPHFEPKGTYEVWRDNLKLWDDDKFLLQQFALGMGFGSPLMELLNESCGAVAFINNESGTGKTMMMYATAGIWGNPKKLVLDKADSVAFKMNRAEVMHSLPTGIDEITNLTPRQMSDLLYQGTSGRQRGRMTASANVERHQGREWGLLMQYTANASVIETVSRGKAMPKAEAQRILECRVERIFDKVKDKELQDTFKSNVFGNYGHAGPPYIQWVMKNLEEARKIVKKVQRRVDEKAQLTSENRYWSDTLTATISGLIISKKVGLHDFDVPKVFNWACTDLIAQNKRGLTEMGGSVQDIMGDFFAENISYILQIKSTADNRGTHGNGLDEHVIPEQVARGKLVARYETDTKLFYVKPKPLKEWCGELQINYAHLKSEIYAKCEGYSKKVRITKGTLLELGSTDVIVMKFDIGSDDEGIEDV